MSVADIISKKLAKNSIEQSTKIIFTAGCCKMEVGTPQPCGNGTCCYVICCEIHGDRIPMDMVACWGLRGHQEAGQLCNVISQLEETVTLRCHSSVPHLHKTHSLSNIHFSNLSNIYDGSNRIFDYSLTFTLPKV